MTEGTTATNPKTGEKVIFRGGKWEPLPTGFQRYFANPVTNAVARGVGGVMSGPGGMVNPSPVAKGIASSIVPQTPTQAAIDIGSIGAGMALPEIEGAGLLMKGARGLGRIGMTAGAGAGGALLEGKSPLTGAAKGAAQQGLGEVGAPIVNKLGSYGKMARNRLDVQRLGGFLKRLGSWLPSPKTVAEFDAQFRGGLATEKVGTRLGKYEAAISKRLGNTPVINVSMKNTGVTSQGPIPMPGGGFYVPKNQLAVTFDEAVKKIRILNDQGRYEGNDATLRYAAKLARQEAHELTEELGNGLNKAVPGLGTRYLGARRQYAGAALLQRLFSEPTLWSADGRLDWVALQELTANRGLAGYRGELNRVFGRDKTDQLLVRIYRNAPPTARDIAGGLNLGVSVHPGVGLPRLWAHPHMTTNVGNLSRRFPPVSPTVIGIGAGQPIVQNLWPNEE